MIGSYSYSYLVPSNYVVDNLKTKKGHEAILRKGSQVMHFRSFINCT